MVGTGAAMFVGFAVLLWPALLVWVFWDVVESLVLRRWFNNHMSEKFGTSVTVKSIRVRRSGILLRDLQIGNDPYCHEVECPYVARLRRLEIKTAGLRSLASCAGMTSFGSVRRKFVVGFLYCEIEQIVAEGVSLYVEEDNAGFVSRYDEGVEEEKRNFLREEAQMLREFRNKWNGEDEEDEIYYEEDEEELTTMKDRMKKVGELMRSKRGISERREALLNLREKFRQADREQRESIEAARSSQKKPFVSDLWRIGKILVINSTLQLRGVQILLDDYELRGFIGNTHALRTKLLNAFIYDMANGKQELLSHRKNQHHQQSSSPSSRAQETRRQSKPHKKHQSHPFSYTRKDSFISEPSSSSSAGYEQQPR